MTFVPNIMKPTSSGARGPGTSNGYRHILCEDLHIKWEPAPQVGPAQQVGSAHQVGPTTTSWTGTSSGTDTTSCTGTTSGTGTSSGTGIKEKKRRRKKMFI